MRANFLPFYGATLSGDLVKQDRYKPSDLEGVCKYDVELVNEDQERIVLECEFVAGQGEYDSISGVVHGLYFDGVRLGDLKGSVLLEEVPAAYVAKLRSISVKA